MINYIEGDLFAAVANTSEKTIICHVVNSKGAWGAGFVVPLAKHYPTSREQYLSWFQGRYNDQPIPFKLGNVQFVNIGNVTIANMLAQTLGGSRPLYYNHLVSCMEEVGEAALNANAEIVCPLFGSGLAQGRWEFIEELIYDCWIRDKNIKTTIYYLPGQTPSGWNPPSN